MRKVYVFGLLLWVTTLYAREGIPFFRNYPSTEYGGHNRNFDVVLGKDGMMYFANFEGLLSFDNAVWRMIYTPGYSRITRLYIDSKGMLWVGGYNLIARLEKDREGKDKLKSLLSDAKIGEVQNIFEEKGQLFFYTDTKVTYRIAGNVVFKVDDLITEDKRDEQHEFSLLGNEGEEMEINQSLLLSNGYQILATVSEGVIVLDQKGERLWTLSEANGLCSNNIKRIAESPNGSVWGVTDNGIFRINVPSMFSQYTQSEQLKGEVTTLRRHRNQLYIGTLQGLYVADGGRVTRIPAVTQACWQLLPVVDDKLYAATSTGVFEVDGSRTRRLTKGYALSLASEAPGKLYVGEVDGIYRLFIDRNKIAHEKIAPFDKIIQLSYDNRSGLTAKSLTGNVYYKMKGSQQFITKGNQSIDNHISEPWGTTECMTALQEKTIRTVYVESDSLVWLGGDFGAICVDTREKDATLAHLPCIYIREVNRTIDTLRFGGEYLKEITFRFSSDALPIHRNVEYQYILEGYDSQWSAWTDMPEKSYTNLNHGNYLFKVRARDSFGRYSAAKEYRFDIPWPFYLKWYSILLYVLIFASLVYGGIRWRLKKLLREKQELERVVAFRTSELRHAQADLVRQEKMATVGKLTKGLIDRILNPLNYINNFSHLSSGLVADLRENLHMAKSGMDKDSYEESVDILDMMESNLCKIEEHGSNTSRVLKAMEEVLKERNRQRQRMDIVALCHRSLDLLREYYKEDIKRMQVSLQAEIPFDTLMIQGNEEQLRKTLMSLLSNGMYALSKKYARQAYPPQIVISMKSEEGFVILCLRDNGIGIEESILEQIFDPFFTTKTTGEAAGVGLYLSKEIITNHHGSIHVHSRKDEYTEIVISLPLE